MATPRPPKTPNYQIRILGGSKASEIGWAITWAKQKLLALARQIKPNLSRRYYYHTNFAGVRSIELNFHAHAGLWLVTFRTDPTVEGVVPIVRERLDATIFPKIVNNPEPIQVSSIALSADGDPINAVRGPALGPGLKITETVFTEDPVPANLVSIDEFDTLREVARQGQAVSFTKLFYRLTLRFGVIVKPPSSLFGLGVPDYFTGFMELLYYEPATGYVTMSMNSSNLQNVITPLPDGWNDKTGGGAATNVQAALLATFSIKLEDLIEADESQFDDDTGLGGITSASYTNVPSGEFRTVSWEDFAGIPSAPVPTADGEFSEDLFTPAHSTTNNGLDIAFSTIIKGTVVGGVAANVTVTLTQMRVGTGNISGNKDFVLKWPAVVQDLRAGIGGQLGLPVNEIIGTGGSSGNDHSRYTISTLPINLSADTTLAHSDGAIGGRVNGVPLPYGQYKYPGDVDSVSAILTPENTLGLSDYETIGSRRSATSHTIEWTIGPYAGMFVSHRTFFDELGSYTTVTILHNDPRAFYSERTQSYDLLRITFSNGIPQYAFIPETSAGSSVSQLGVLPRNEGTISNPGMSFSAMPHRSGKTINIGSGTGIFKASPFAQLAEGSHTLFSAVKLSPELEAVPEPPLPPFFIPGAITMALAVLQDPVSGLFAVQDIGGGFFFTEYLVLDAAGDLVTSQKGNYRGDFKKFNIGNFSLFRWDQKARERSNVGAIDNSSRWGTQALEGVGRGIGWHSFFPSEGGQQITDAFISSQDAGLPTMVPFSMLWIIDDNTAGVFMAGWTTNRIVYQNARQAWVNAKVANEEAPVIEALKVAAIAELDILFNNFASDEFILAAGNTTGVVIDRLIVQE